MSYTGKTKNLGIIGYPVEHSLSPAMQLAALEQAKLDYSYIAMPVMPSALGKAAAGLASLGFRGFNVTIPHKINIIPYLAGIDEDAKMIGAVNTVVIEQGQMWGYNTDSIGFITALHKKSGVIIGKSAVLLGAGGAARAVIWGLLGNGIDKLTIGVRNPDKVKQWVQSFAVGCELQVLHWADDLFKQELARADLLINTTPLGMAPQIEQMPPVDWEIIRPATFVADLIYTPERTKFLQMAQKNGNQIMNGSGMLVEQGAAAFKLWTGENADTKLMHQVLQYLQANK